MRKAASCLFSAFIIGSQLFPTHISADAAQPDKAPQQASAPVVALPFKAFTGKITKNKVRLRLQPNLDGKIIREFNRDDMLIVVGASEDFYIVQPPQDLKAYVFRTFILDNTVEGNHVNVRLEPDTDSPVIAQLNSGEKVEGTISPLNSKWMEILPPISAKFYVCKEYVENIGSPSLMGNLVKRREEVNTLLNTTYQISQAELQKPYDQIRLDTVFENINRVSKQFADFPDQVTRAKELLSLIQDTYLQKKIAYLEAKANGKEIPQAPLTTQKIEPQAAQETPRPKSSNWNGVEASIYEEWLKDHPDSNMDDFYADQKNESKILTGVIEPYIRSVRNKPGDYILISKTSRLPTAYLYSTKVDLQSKAGKEITVVAASRPNNDFAFPAYFVISIE